MYDSERNVLIALGCVLRILSTTPVILRFVARRTKSNYIGIDDWLILIGGVRVCALHFCTS